MKKILCAVLALAAMASCTKEYTIDNPKQAIAFGEAFVNNGTRADYSTDKSVSTFKVWGTVAGNYTTTPVYIFNGDEVKNTNGTTTVGYGAAWYCNNIQYWVPNADYAFTAIVDGEFAKTGDVYDYTKIPFTVADGTNNKDLLLATATARVANDGTVTGTNIGTNSLVKFNFDHLLSKVGFTVTGNIGTGYSIKVTGITVENVAENGIYTVGATTPWAQDGATKTALTFGADGTETRQILPVEQTLKVTVAYDIYYGDTQISSATKSGTVTETFAKNTVYNITATITMTNEIQFTVNSVNGWNNTVVTAPLQ